MIFDSAQNCLEAFPVLCVSWWLCLKITGVTLLCPCADQSHHILLEALRLGCWIPQCDEVVVKQKS